MFVCLGWTSVDRIMPRPNFISKYHIFSVGYYNPLGKSAECSHRNREGTGISPNRAWHHDRQLLLSTRWCHVRPSQPGYHHGTTRHWLACRLYSWSTGDLWTIVPPRYVLNVQLLVFGWVASNQYWSTRAVANGEMWAAIAPSEFQDKLSCRNCREPVALVDVACQSKPQAPPRITVAVGITRPAREVWLHLIIYRDNSRALWSESCVWSSTFSTSNDTVYHCLEYLSNNVYIGTRAVGSPRKFSSELTWRWSNIMPRERCIGLALSKLYLWRENRMKQSFE